LAVRETDVRRVPTIADLHAARARIAAATHVTPVVHSELLQRHVPGVLHFKCENLQKTGSFKSRGALNAVSCLDEAQRSAGVVSVSAGNHAQALAWAAAAQGISCTVVMPSTATRSKVDASEGYGATVIFESGSAAAFERALKISEEEGRTFVHPFDDADIIAGAGTVGLEICEQISQLDILVVPVGGGGLISGVLVAVKQLLPHVRVYGVEPSGAAVMHQSLIAGHPTRLDHPPRTIADGLASPMAGQLTYAIVSTLADGIVVVEDDAIADAMRLLITRTKLLVEPAGAAAFAALIGGLIPDVRGSVGVIVSGGNVDLARLA
jgi:threonine dehydratase